jgi:DNA-binding transcriptional MerR regulator
MGEHSTPIGADDPVFSMGDTAMLVGLSVDRLRHYDDGLMPERVGPRFVRVYRLSRIRAFAIARGIPLADIDEMVARLRARPKYHTMVAAGGGRAR